MTVEEFITSYQMSKKDSEVFFIKKTIDKFAHEFALDKKKETNKWKCYELKYKLMFYWIFIHNVSFASEFNNEYGFWICPKENFSNIDYRHYREFIDHMVKNKLIIYPIKSKSAGTNINTKIHITKIVKVAKELVGCYSQKQLNYFSAYLIHESDPEGVLKLTDRNKDIKTAQKSIEDKIYNIPTYINYYVPNYEQNKITSNIEYIKQYSNVIGYNNIDKELIKSILLNKTLDNKISSFEIKTLNIFNYLKSYSKILQIISFKKYLMNENQFQIFFSYIQYINNILKFNGLPELLIHKFNIYNLSKYFSLKKFRYLYVYTYTISRPTPTPLCVPWCTSIYIYASGGAHFLSNLTDISTKLTNFNEILEKLSIKKVNLLDEKNKYNILDIYKLIKLDQNKLADMYYNNLLPENKLIYYDTLNKYINQNYTGKIDNRIFTWFHGITANARKAFMINGSYLKEAFDIHACAYCILAKLFETIDYKKINEFKINEWNDELKKFQNIVKNDYIYKQIANFGEIDLAENKKLIKKVAQAWLNMLNSTLTRSLKQQYFSNTENQQFKDILKIIDTYFTQNFPLITDVLKHWKIEKKKKQNKNKRTQYSKTIWRDYQKIEFNLITEKMCNYLYFTYGILPVTVHDALYLSEDDFNYVSQYENLEKLFWSLLNFKYFPESTEIKRIKEISAIERKFYSLMKSVYFNQNINYNIIINEFNKVFDKFYSIRNKNYLSLIR